MLVRPSTVCPECCPLACAKMAFVVDCSEWMAGSTSSPSRNIVLQRTKSPLMRAEPASSTIHQNRKPKEYRVCTSKPNLPTLAVEEIINSLRLRASSPASRRLRSEARCYAYRDKSLVEHVKKEKKSVSHGEGSDRLSKRIGKGEVKFQKDAKETRARQAMTRTAGLLRWD